MRLMNVPTMKTKTSTVKMPKGKLTPKAAARIRAKASTMLHGTKARNAESN